MKSFSIKIPSVGRTLALTAIFVCLSACGQNRALKVKDFSLEATKIYYGDLDSVDSFDLYFSDATGKVPYVDLVTSLNKLFNSKTFSAKKDGAGLTVVRGDNGAKVHIDPKKKEITFSDYDLFKMNAGAVSLLDIVVTDDIITHCDLATYENRGEPITVYYGTFLIDMAIDKNIALLPLQTFVDVFLSGNTYGAVLYNGDEIFYVYDKSSLFNDSFERTELGKKYYSAAPSELDAALADFNMRELALNFQLNYGLRELRGIEKFSDWFETHGLLERLSSTDANEVDLAIKEICYQYFGDIHSSFEAHSPYAKFDKEKEREENQSISTSPSYRRINQSLEDAKETRGSFFPDGLPGIQKIGDTLYVTLANEVVQEDPTIRNVVVDISCNTGGGLDEEVFVACWLLGFSHLQIQSGTTGCQSATSYLADVNFDGEVTQEDNVRDRRLFCLVSDITFSCGNLLASMLKESGRATLIGSKTGGGACAVYPASSAIGTYFNTSSHFRFSAEKNGVFKDIDDGVSPDYKLTELRSFYNRTAFIKKLY